MTLQAITVIGHDRPGIIAETTRILAGLGLNIEDSTMTLLRGHFAMMLICAGEAGSAEIEASLAPMTEDGSLNVSVREVPEEGEHEAVGSTYVLTVHGGDRAGIGRRLMAESARFVGEHAVSVDGRVIEAPRFLVATGDLTKAESQLEEFGYHVLSADSGPAALEIIEKEPGIDLLFTDVIMSGGMNGPELVELARRIRPKLKVLYTSGYTENAVIHHGRLDKGVQLLQKPYRRNELAAKVQDALNQ